MSPDISSPVSTILIVDDQAAVRSLIGTTLQARGYHTLDAADGLAAWQILTNRRNRIHCLVTDFVLPGLSGGVLVELTRELWPRLPVLIMSDQPHAHVTDMLPSLKDVPVLLVSPLSGSAQEIGGASLGRVDYFEKPIDLARLATAARAALPPSPRKLEGAPT